MEHDRLYERLERLESSRERYGALLEEHSRRLEALEDLPNLLGQLYQAIGRLEAKIETSKQVNQLLQALLWLLLGGVVAAGFELFRR